MTYYNDNDSKSAAWLRELIIGGHISPGVVDERSITEVSPDGVAVHRRAHFFAGIGGWDLAMQISGVPAALSIWSGSCPCQPFSVAGAGRGVDDPRHLWPQFARLIGECRPAVVVGEQVASRAGREWLAGVRADMEAMGYAVGAADLCAPGVAAPHLRQRLYWVAYRDGQGWRERGRAERLAELPPGHESDRRGADGGVAYSESERRQRWWRTPAASWDESSRCGAPCGLPDATQQHGTERGRSAPLYRWSRPWADFDICHDRDGKARRIEPGLVPLVDGLPGRVGLLRGYGNAIVPQLAAAFLVAAGLAPPS